MEGVRLRANHPVVDATLARIEGRPLGLHRDVELKRFELHRPEAAVTDMLRTRKMTVAELLGSGVGQDRVIKMMLYALAITRCLDIGVAGRAPVGSGRAQESPSKVRPAPAPVTPEVERAPARGGEGDAAKPAAAPVGRTGFGMGFGRPAAKAADPQAPAPPEVHTRPTSKMAKVETPADPATRPVEAAPEPAAPSRRMDAPQRAPERAESARAPAPPPPPRASAAPNPGPARAPATSVPPNSGPPSRDAATRRAEITDRAAAIDSEDFFQLLQVSREANQDLIQASYFALAKAWHPDRVQADLEDVKPLVAKVFARLNEAYQTLSDTTKRNEYTRLLQHGAERPERRRDRARRRRCDGLPEGRDPPQEARFAGSRDARARGRPGRPGLTRVPHAPRLDPVPAPRRSAAAQGRRHLHPLRRPHQDARSRPREGASLRARSLLPGFAPQEVRSQRKGAAGLPPRRRD